MRVKTLWQIIAKSFKKFVDDDASTLAASLAFFTIFSLAPLLILSLKLFSSFLDKEHAREQLMRTLGEIIGYNNAETLNNILENANLPEGSAVGTILAFAFLIFGATTVFGQLKLALNRFWGVREHQQNFKDPWYGFFISLAKTRIVAVILIIVIGALLGLSVVFSTILRATQTVLAPQFPHIGPLWQILDILLSLLVITLLFGFILKIVPDVYMRWRDVWVGATVSAILFVVGKTIIAYYLSRYSLLSAYGAAGSILAFFIWIFISAQIFYFGAELTHSYANSLGAGIEPQDRGRLVVKFFPSSRRRKTVTADAHEDPIHHPDVRQD